MEGLSSANYRQDMRRYERRPYSKPIHYSVSVLESKDRKLLSLKGQSVDISETGICIQTDHPLSPGHILWFDGSFDGSIEDKAGFVRWCQQLNDEYKVGIELDKEYSKALDEATDLFNERLEEIEKRCENSDETPEELYKATSKAIDDVLVMCEAFEKGIKDKNIIQDARIRFREKTNHILSKSFFLNRARTWPQGYQGDYKMLEHFYRNTPLSGGIGHYLDLCILNAQLVIAVRNRIKELETILRYELQKRQRPSVLNIACGSCREVFELAADIENSRAQFTCTDLDNDALSFAANRLSYTNISPLTSNQVKLRKYNALRMFDHELNMSEFEKQDIIYSVGFFDYLSNDFLIKMMRALYKLLNPGGILIAAFKDAHKYRSVYCHWIVDWDGFLQRTEEDFKNVFSEAGIPYLAVTEAREETGIIVFYMITK